MIRQIASQPDRIFLTFDDGPDERNTARVLDILKAAGARATFFLVACKIEGQRSLVERIVREGHALGNHSWDHAYRNYFKGAVSMRRWITDAQAEFQRLNLPVPVGFRPPAGIVTPIVKKVLDGLEEPLVMWNERFYDAVRRWTSAQAERSAAQIKGGSLVLLHDRRRQPNDTEFYRTLEVYIERLHARGFQLEGLTRQLCIQMRDMETQS